MYRDENISTIKDEYTTYFDYEWKNYAFWSQRFLLEKKI